jgi:hypothetical protein
MTEEQQTLEAINEEIAKLPLESREIVATYAENLRQAASKDPRVLIAIALVGAEVAAQ